MRPNKWIYSLSLKVLGGPTHYIYYYSSLKKAREAYYMRREQCVTDESYETIKEHTDHIENARGVSGTLAQLNIKHKECKSTALLKLNKIKVN